MSKSDSLEPQKKHPVPNVLSFLGLEGVTPRDSFSLNYREGILEANVVRQDGKTEHVIKHVKGGGFSEVTTFEPQKMSKEDRDALIRSRYDKGETQTELAKKFGLSQARVSSIVKNLG